MQNKLPRNKMYLVLPFRKYINLVTQYKKRIEDETCLHEPENPATM